MAHIMPVSKTFRHRYLKLCNYLKFGKYVSFQVLINIKVSKRGHVVISNLNHMRLGGTLTDECDIDALKAFHHFFNSLVACQNPSNWLLLKSLQYVKSYKILRYELR